MSSPLVVSKVYTKEELCLFERIPRPCAIVVFGASGDLAHRKLFPALFYLYEQNLLPKAFYILGAARTAMTMEAFREGLRKNLPKAASSESLEKFLHRCHYLAGSYSAPGTYASIQKTLLKFDKEFNVSPRRLYYLSTPPEVFEDILENLGTSGLAACKETGTGCAAVVVEKPFGHSLASARDLNEKMKKVLREEQIYRIDHYLAKETVQNILMFRFANILFEPVWNRNYIDHVQISALERLGVEHRAGYYDRAGVVRDMLQNHMLQLMALIAMEPPTSLEADAVRDKRIDVFRSLKTFSPKEVASQTVCSQYAAGSIDGKPVAGYREEAGIDPRSHTPTYVAVKLELDDWRWKGVPFYIRTGKRMGPHRVEIAVHFKHVPTSIFKPLLAEQLTPNVLKFRIQPDEGITMGFEAKHPGPKLCMSTVTMDFGYEKSFGLPPPEAYARLFLDVMLGDQTLFARSDGVEEAWRLVDPIINYWEGEKAPPLPVYPAGSLGPTEADALIARDGRTWD
ncbi:MAG: glucose-6-phosphate dehydrogenase [Elusimicrobia bacterium]|nr:glucose-6-phosphate dehydrogenase [Candidatus Obscuribacterium magneticum]